MNRSKDHMVPTREARMQFKTAQQIREEREAAGKDKEREARQREKLAEKASRKYARMAEEAEKREAARKAQAPKLVVNRENVIVAPALLAEKVKPAVPVKRPGKDAAKAKAQADAAAVRTGEVSPSAGSEPHTVVEKTARQAEKIRNFGKNYDAGAARFPKPEAKQVWDETTKSWVKRG